MSQVKVSGNASGTGVFTIAAPNSNTNRTLTLPDNTGTLVTTGSSGTILKAQSFYNAGTSTSSTSAVSLQGSRFSYTPVSTSSILVFTHSAYTYLSPSSGYATGSLYGTWKISEYNGSTDVGVSDAAYLWNYQYATTYMQSIGAQSTLQWYSPNSSLTPRLFSTVGNVTNANATLGMNAIYLTIIEVAN